MITLNEDTRYRLIKFRKQLNLRQVEMAARLRITQTSYSNMENGRTKALGGQTVELLEKELDLNIQWLKTGIGEMTNRANQEMPEGMKKESLMITIERKEYLRLKQQVDDLLIINRNLSEMLADRKKNHTADSA